MTIESKPLLILNMMAFKALIAKLKLNRKSMDLKTDAGREALKQLDETLVECEAMLDAIINELAFKHDYVDPN